MRVTIVGSGPAGLYLALLLKKLDPHHEISVLERDGPHDTYGWGIVFSDQTLSYLEENDAPSHAEVLRRFETWDSVLVVHRGETIRIRGNKFSGIARVTFLEILRERCRELGVEQQFYTQVTDVGSLRACDLLVAADGANSLVRRTYSDAFGPTVAQGKNKFIWLGTEKRFDGLSLIFRSTEAGLFVAHAYSFSPKASTFIVECVGDAWRRAAFDRASDDETCARLAEIFSADLEGRPLLSNNFVRWLHFPIVKNRRWFTDNVVLLGDAAHTAHFSIGSGTKLAVEDSIALARAFAEAPAVEKALPLFEGRRKPILDAYQEAAHSSLLWFENAEEKLHLEPLPFAYELMTRSRRIDFEKLRKRDPEFAAAYERWRA